MFFQPFMFLKDYKSLHLKKKTLQAKFNISSYGEENQNMPILQVPEELPWRTGLKK